MELTAAAAVEGRSSFIPLEEHWKNEKNGEKMDFIKEFS